MQKSAAPAQGRPARSLLLPSQPQLPTLAQGHDAAALLWALGTLRMRPADDQLQVLLRRLGGQLQDLDVSQLTAAAAGALQLDPAPTELLAELLRALNAQVRWQRRAAGCGGCL